MVCDVLQVKFSFLNRLQDLDNFKNNYTVALINICKITKPLKFILVSHTLNTFKLLKLKPGKKTKIVVQGKLNKSLSIAQS